MPYSRLLLRGPNIWEINKYHFGLQKFGPLFVPTVKLLVCGCVRAYEFMCMCMGVCVHGYAYVRGCIHHIHIVILGTYAVSG